MILLETVKFANDDVYVMLVRHTEKMVIEVIAIDAKFNSVIDRIYACGRKIRSKANRQTLNDLSRKYDMESSEYYRQLNKAVMTLTSNFLLDHLRVVTSPKSGKKCMFFVNSSTDTTRNNPSEFPSFQYDVCPDWITPYDIEGTISGSEVTRERTDSKEAEYAAIGVDDVLLRCCELPGNVCSIDNSNNICGAKPTLASKLLKQLSPLVSRPGSHLLLSSSDHRSDAPTPVVTPPTVTRKRITARLIPLSLSPAKSSERPASADSRGSDGSKFNGVYNSSNNNINDGNDAPRRMSWNLRLAPLKPAL